MIFAPGRAKRPTDYAVSRGSQQRAETATCPFCPGNENLTPPAELLFAQSKGKILKLRDSGSRRRSDWLVRCVRNMYPALSPNSRSVRGSVQGRFRYLRHRAEGFHEVLIESPSHNDHPHHAAQRQTELWLQGAIDRISALEGKRSTAAIALFRNHGKEAGASLTHAHSQIIASPMVPPKIQQEEQALKRIKKETGECALCQIRAAESRSERKILDQQDFTVFAPWASIFPFEFWIVPKRHSNTIVDLSQQEITSLATTIRLAFGALARTVLDPPYNSIFHLVPSMKAEGFHWHLEVYPKLAIHAGFELGTGMYINSMKPEIAAKALAKSVAESQLA